jgi:hypothetical protein
MLRIFTVYKSLFNVLFRDIRTNAGKPSIEEVKDFDKTIEI